MVAGGLTVPREDHAVNIASRMESSGISNCIQITESTFQLIKDKFYCDERGFIDIKGKGKVKTFLLKEKKYIKN